MNIYKDQREWSDALIPTAVPSILQVLNLDPDVWDIYETTPEQDMNEAADLVLTNGIEVYKIAYRIRNGSYINKYPYDFTVRRQYTKGYKTEYEKILADGFADFMFYGFRLNNKIVRWVFILLDAYRAEHYQDENGIWLPNKYLKYELLKNTDGINDFYGYDITSFKNKKIIIGHSLGYTEDVVTKILPGNVVWHEIKSLDLRLDK